MLNFKYFVLKCFYELYVILEAIIKRFVLNLGFLKDRSCLSDKAECFGASTKLRSCLSLSFISLKKVFLQMASQ